jgi:hypothetical protein
MVQDGQNGNARRPDDIEDEIREARHDRTPDVTVDDGTCSRKRTYGLEPLPDGQQELVAEPWAL